MSPADVLTRAAVRLARRIEELEARLDADESAWPEYLDAVRTLAAMLAHVHVGRPAALLTTRQLAEQFGVAAKTVRSWRQRGIITPAIEAGRRGRAALRWSANSGGAS